MSHTRSGPAFHRPAAFARSWPVSILLLAACSSAGAGHAGVASPGRPAEPVTIAAPPAPTGEPPPAPTEPASDGGAAPPPAPTSAVTPLEAMAATPTPIFIRGKRGCDEWALSGQWGETLEQLHVERIVQARKKRRKRLQLVFDYSKGHVIDSASVIHHEDVWNAVLGAWEQRRLRGETHACSSIYKPVLEEDGSISFGPHRWYRTAESCRAARTARIEGGGGSDGVTPRRRATHRGACGPALR